MFNDYCIFNNEIYNCDTLSGSNIHLSTVDTGSTMASNQSSMKELTFETTCHFCQMICKV